MQCRQRLLPPRLARIRQRPLSVAECFRTEGVLGQRRLCPVSLLGRLGSWLCIGLPVSRGLLISQWHRPLALRRAQAKREARSWCRLFGAFRPSREAGWWMHHRSASRSVLHERRTNETSLTSPLAGSRPHVVCGRLARAAWYRRFLPCGCRCRLRPSPPAPGWECTRPGPAQCRRGLVYTGPGRVGLGSGLAVGASPRCGGVACPDGGPAA